MDKRFFTAAILVLSAISANANAQLHKCVNAEGKATYTDQPCAIKSGEKSADANDAAIRKITAISKFKDVGKTCWQFEHRATQCYDVQSQDLRTVFRENCTLPAKKFEEEQYKDQRRTKKYNQENEDGDDLEYSHRYTRKSRAVLRCESLDREIWDFLNQQFPNKITDADRKIIVHQLQITPTKSKY
ncbi:DUF4124 domain-containing protein [Undibacterium sp. LX40W]|uniref:DUF4124 domain-containing protein n=1 Tax=Undibacterium nitidum TaxID=2762298 RepID=A0A923HJS9_9BURK|nr:MULTISPECIES: DUF4124 domain-containing protein [Undibacterium]MBC3880699.1 DUF4124 domain-containing protein [Undibacterium nitidum]MBC3890566.1 DUF4124 domain-containing protein [Undibacterium sp. LX40W]